MGKGRPLIAAKSNFLGVSYCIYMTLLLTAIRMKGWNNISRFLLLTSIITNHQFLYQFNASWNGNKLFLNCTLLLLRCWSSYFCDSRCWCVFNCSLSSEYPGSDWCWLRSSFCRTNSKVFQEIKIKMIPLKACVVRPLLLLPVKHFKIFLKYFTMKYFLNMKMSRDNYDSHLTSFI